MKAVHAKASESGQLNVPAEFRKQIGLEQGGDVVIELDGKAIRIRAAADPLAEAQGWTRKILGNRPGTSVDDFIAERRREAAADDKAKSKPPAE
jgi:bifunctional DNA-binding transcriptional regulator/antitoxin component of YhaV-PrlF toxin-antitoxin module